MLLAATVLIGYFATPFYSFLNPGNGIWTNINDGTYPTTRIEKLQAVQSPVYILRDNYGVPHIYAQNELDLYYAWGYVHAQDRLFQMDIFRRVAEGRLSEVLGNTTYETDLFYRSINLTGYAQETYNAFNQTIQGLLKAYSAGVNQYISEIQNNLPMEFKILGYTPPPWTPLDTVTFGKFETWSLSADFNSLTYAKLLAAFGNDTLQQLFPLQPPNETTIIPPGVTGPPLAANLPPAASELTPQNLQAIKTLLPSINSLSNWLQRVQIPLLQPAGSNSWVVSGTKTTTGKPFLANDPHLSLLTPSLWYEVHLNINSTNTTIPTLNERGVSFPGIPTIIIGHNDQIAWGLTVFPVAATDLVYYKFNPSQSQYYYNGAYRPVMHEIVDIRVKTSNTLTDHQITLNATLDGPLLTMNGTAYAVRWTGKGYTKDFLTFYKLGYAKNLADFKHAVENFQAAQQNFVYADIKGNIAYVGAGLIPVRRNGYGRIPVNGSVPDYQWTGFLPFSQLPQIVNPSDGFIVTANNRPITSETPFYSSFYAEHYRAQRITELLNVTTPLNFADMQRIQTDTLSIEARDLVPYIRNALPYTTNQINVTTPNVYQLVALLNWDYIMKTDSVAPTIFTLWLSHYATGTWGDQYNAAGISGPYPFTETLDSLTQTNSRFSFVNASSRDDIIRKAMDQTFTDILTMFNLPTTQSLFLNKDSFTYGHIHTYNMQHPLGSALSWLSFPRLPANGGENTVNVASGLSVTAGPSFRQIIDLNNIQGSLDIIPGGQSGFRFNPHWDDQLTLWQQGYYKLMLSPTNRIKLPQIESNLTLTPLTPYLNPGA